MRQLVPGLALLAVSACGQATGRPAAAPAPTITVEAARAVAKAGTLTKADLPGYRRAPGGAGLSAADTAEALRPRGGSCLRDFPSLAAGGATFGKGSVVVASETDVTPTEAAARDVLAYAKGPEFGPCFERAITASAAAGGVTVLRYRATAFRVQVPGAAGAFGYTATMTARDDGRRAPVTMHFVGASAGNAFVTVVATGVRDEPPSRARMTALLRTLVQRAAAKQR